MNEIDKYILKFPIEVQKKLIEIRKTILSTKPKLEERLSWRMPSYYHNGNVILFAGFKDHVSIFPTSTPIVKFKKEFLKYKTSKGTIQIPFDEPIPKNLIKKIIKFKIAENKNKKKIN